MERETMQNIHFQGTLRQPVTAVFAGVLVSGTVVDVAGPALQRTRDAVCAPTRDGFPFLARGGALRRWH